MKQFSLLLIVIIVFEIGIGAFGYIRKDDLNDALDKGFNQTLKDYKTNEKAWDLVQTEVWMAYNNSLSYEKLSIIWNNSLLTLTLIKQCHFVNDSADEMLWYQPARWLLPHSQRHRLTSIVLLGFDQGQTVHQARCIESWLQIGIAGILELSIDYFGWRCRCCRFGSGKNTFTNKIIAFFLHQI